MNEKPKDSNNRNLKNNNNRQEKLVKLMDVINVLVDERFTGYIKVNFSQGGISRIEKFEEIMK